MWSIFIPAAQASLDSFVFDLWQMGPAGCIEEVHGLRAFFDDTLDPSAICQQLNLPLSHTRHESPFDPTSLTPVECDPILIGDRFYVAPSWRTDPPPEGRFRITIDTTSAFGSGRHESTQLCMEVLEKHLRPGACVADIGCGSGILTAAALLLGASSVISCDIHQDSVRTAQSFIQSPIFVGSADGIRSAFADVVLANLSVKVLDVVAADLQRIAKPDAIIVIGGFLHNHTPRKFTALEVWEKGDWQCWVCRREDIAPSAEPAEPSAHSEQWW